jgi:hypothetical protein
VSIEDDAQKDLALNPEDAENVVGGVKKKKAKKAAKHAVHKAAGHAGPNINIQTPMTPSSDETSTAPYDPEGEGTEQGGL